MAKGKNKKLSKKGKIVKKGEKHPFTKKEWFNVIAPAALRESKSIGWTCCKKPTGTQIVSDFLKNRVAEMSYADLTNSAADVSKRIKLLVEDIQGSSCFTSFHSFELSRDKISAMLKKRQTLVEIVTEVKTSDGVVFRIFVVAVTNRRQGQLKLNSYAKSSKVRLLRKRLTTDLLAHSAKLSSANLIHEVVSQTINSKLEKAATEVIPGVKLQIGKLKIVKRGNVDMVRATEEVKAQVAVGNDNKRKENPDAQNVLSKKED
jgi:small subunit ribosomal protein S3Ae